MYFFWPRLNAQRSALSPECVNMDIHGYQDGYWGVRNAEDLNRYVSASERRETEEMEGLHILGLHRQVLMKETSLWVTICAPVSNVVRRGAQSRQAHGDSVWMG